MPEEDAPTVVTSQSDLAQSGRHAEVAADPADDWLADDSELEWFPPSETATSQRAGASTGRGASPTEASDGPPHLADLFRRRRAIALVAVLAVIVIAVLVPLLMLGGGGGQTATTGSTPATTTPPATTPATSPAATTTATKPTTTTTTTPSTPAGGSGTVALPTSGTLRPGDTSDQVKTLQQALNTLAVGQTLTVDGIYGPLTQQEVVSFPEGERAHGRRSRRRPDRAGPELGGCRQGLGRGRSPHPVAVAPGGSAVVRKG